MANALSSEQRNPELSDVHQVVNNVGQYLWTYLKLIQEERQSSSVGQKPGTATIQPDLPLRSSDVGETPPAANADMPDVNALE